MKKLIYCRDKQFMKKHKKVALYSLGCKLNFSEISTLARMFEEKGYERVNFSNKADVYIINTCAVTEKAEKKSRRAIHRAINLSGNAIIAVIGCYAQLSSKRIAAIPGVDIVLGNEQKGDLLNYIETIEKNSQTIIHSCETCNINCFFPSYSIGDRTRSFLKVQDGCNYYCAYCTIPYARGKSRNSSIKDTVKQAVAIARTNVKEIVLTGVNTGDFGRSTNEKFIDLINELDKNVEIERFRISSIEPNLLTEEIIDFVIQSEKFVPHFHIPLQAGSNKILGLMKRRYKRELFAQRIEYIKSKCREACIGIDIIVGFPGETEADFSDAYNFVRQLDISYLHVFPYSERPGTTAMLLQEQKCTVKEKEYRSKKFLELSINKKFDFYTENLYKKFTVLYESKTHENTMVGFTGNYIKIEAPYNPELLNTIEVVTLWKINGNRNVEILDKR